MAISPRSPANEKVIRTPCSAPGSTHLPLCRRITNLSRSNLGNLNPQVNLTSHLSHIRPSRVPISRASWPAAIFQTRFGRRYELLGPCLVGVQRDNSAPNLLGRGPIGEGQPVGPRKLPLESRLLLLRLSCNLRREQC